MNLSTAVPDAVNRTVLSSAMIVLDSAAPPAANREPEEGYAPLVKLNSDAPEIENRPVDFSATVALSTDPPIVKSEPEP